MEGQFDLLNVLVLRNKRVPSTRLFDAAVRGLRNETDLPVQRAESLIIGYVDHVRRAPRRVFVRIQSRRWLYTLIGKKERRWHRSIYYMEGGLPRFSFYIARRKNRKTRRTTLQSSVTRLSRLPNRYTSMCIGGGDNSITETNHIIIPVLHGYCASAIKAVGRRSSMLEFFSGTNLEINFYKPRRPVYKHIQKLI